MAMRNPLNRRMRTRMYGGVAGADGRPSPLCRLRCAEHVRQLGGESPLLILMEEKS